MTEEIEPVFLLSLPRSGSTLLQRLLAAHPAIATGTEPYLVLPFAYTLHSRGVAAEYDHQRFHGALEDFFALLPKGRDTYLDELQTMLVRLYRQAAGPGPQLFIDKTPRYSLIAHDLAELFPTARFVVLWRNPLSVVASIVRTFQRGRWDLRGFHVQLFEGLERLLSFVDTYPERIVEVRYRDIVQQPEETVGRIFSFLDVRQDESVVERFTDVALEGRHGDKVGVRTYSQVSAAPLRAWRDVVTNRVRRRWCERWLDTIGADGLARMGYDHGRLRRELAEVPMTTDNLLRDIAFAPRGPTAPRAAPGPRQPRCARGAPAARTRGALSDGSPRRRPRALPAWWPLPG